MAVDVNAMIAMSVEAKEKLIRSVKVAQYEEIVKGKDASQFWHIARDLSFGIAEENMDLMDCTIDQSKCLLDVEEITEEPLADIYFDAIVEIY